MTVQPTTWTELMSNAHYDELSDEHGPLADSPAILPRPAGERRPVTNSTPAAPGACGPAFASSHPSAKQGTADTSVTSGRRDANFPPITACVCGLVSARPAHPWGYCGGGRECLERLMQKEEPEAADARTPAQTTEPMEDSMTQEFTEAASWRNVA